MNGLLILGICNAFFIIGIWEAGFGNMILSRFKRYATRRLPEWLYKPLIVCPNCMASLWGFTYLCVYSAIINNFYLLIWSPLYIPMVSGIVAVMRYFDQDE